VTLAADGWPSLLSQCGRIVAAQRSSGAKGRPHDAQPRFLGPSGLAPTRWRELAGQKHDQGAQHLLGALEVRAELSSRPWGALKNVV